MTLAILRFSSCQLGQASYVYIYIYIQRGGGSVILMMTYAHYDRSSLVAIWTM